MCFSRKLKNLLDVTFFFFFIFLLSSFVSNDFGIDFWFILYHVILSLITLRKKQFGNIVGKRENARNKPFLLFPQYFDPYQWQITSFEPTLELLPAKFSLMH